MVAKHLEQGSIGNARTFLQEEALLDKDLVGPRQANPIDDGAAAFTSWLDTCRA